MRTHLAVIFVAAAFLIPAAIAPSASAQDYAIDQGSMIIGGSASLTSSSRSSFFSEDNRRIDLSIQPQVQYFVTPNWAIGGTTLFGVSNLGSSERETDVFFGAGPAFSYYFGGEDSTVYPYLSTSALVLGGDRELYRGTASAGAAWMVSRNVALTGEGFLEADLEDTSNNIFGLRFGVRVFVW